MTSLGNFPVKTDLNRGISIMWSNSYPIKHVVLTVRIKK